MSSNNRIIFNKLKLKPFISQLLDSTNFESKEIIVLVIDRLEYALRVNIVKIYKSVTKPKIVVFSIGLSFVNGRG